MEINSNPSYVYNIKNQNAQVAGSITAETIEENLFTNITQELENQGITEDSQIGDINFASLFANIFASLPTIFENLFNKTSNQQEKADTNANKIKDLEARKSELETEKQKVTDTYFEKVTNMDSNGMFYMDDDAAAVEEYQTNMANINTELSNIESQIRQLNTQENTPSAEPAPEELQYKLESDTTQVTEIENGFTLTAEPVNKTDDDIDRDRADLQAPVVDNIDGNNTLINDEVIEEIVSDRISVDNNLVNNTAPFINWTPPNVALEEKSDAIAKQIAELTAEKVKLQQEKNLVSEEYVRLMNDKSATITRTVFDTATNTEKTVTEELNYENLLKSGKYRLIEPETGNVTFLNENEVARYIKKEDFEYTDEHGQTCLNEKAYYRACREFLINMSCMPALENTEYTQQMILSGVLGIQEQLPDGSWKTVQLSEVADINLDYNTNNDNAAEAEYQQTSLQIQAKEKAIEEQLKILNEALAVTTETPTNYQMSNLLNQKADLLLEKIELSKNYTEAMNDTKLTYTFFKVVTTGKEFKEDLSYEYLCGEAGVNNYRLTDPNTGKILCLEEDEVLKYITEPRPDYEAYCNEHGFLIDREAYEEACRAYDEACQEFIANNMIIMPELADPNWLANALQTNAISVEKFTKNPDLAFDKGSWKETPLNEIPEINVEFNTDNDASATADYTYKNLKIDMEIAKIDEQLENLKDSNTPSYKPFIQTIPASPSPTPFRHPFISPSTINPSLDILYTTPNISTPEVTTPEVTTPNETPNTEPTSTNSNKNYIERQVERYEKYIAKYEKQIEILESGNDSNKEAKIASLEQKIEKYMSKIQELID
ncbi:hypothetical protein IJE86_10875 [bacterium]|nr:hypothetical protein [bacterium]